MTAATFETPNTLSPSRISAFRNCPLQFRFASLEKLPQPPQIHLVKGNFVHRVLELLLGHEPENRTVESAREAFATARAEYEPSNRFLALGLSDDAREAFFKDSRDLVNGYYRMENPRNANVIGLELRIDSDFGRFILGGIIDRLERNEKGELVVSDYKTGRVPDARFGDNKMDNMQIYASLCLRERGELPKKLRLMYLKTSTPIEFDVTSETNEACERAAINTFEQIDASCQSGVFATKKSGLCNSCAFKKWCPEFGGDDSLAKVEAPKLYPTIPRD
ncbi:MAG: RecB family exonuclease [Actinomycetota bacterium]